MTALAVPDGRTKRQALNERKRKKFLTMVSDGYSVAKSAEGAKMSKQTAYNWRREDADFARAWDEAWAQGCDVLEDIAQERAVDKSDLLLIFLMKGRRPDRYRDNVKHESDVRVTVTVSDARAELAARFEQIEQHRQAAIEGKSRQLEPAPSSSTPTTVA